MATAQVHNNPSALKAIKLVVDNDHKALKKHIKRGGDFMGYDNTGWAAIHYAAHLGRMQCLRIILANGGRVDQPTIGPGLSRPQGGENKNPNAASTSSSSS